MKQNGGAAGQAREFTTEDRPRLSDVISTRTRPDGSKYPVCKKRGVALIFEVGDRYRILAPLEVRERLGFKKGRAIGEVKVGEGQFIFCVVSVRGEKMADVPFKELSRRVELRPVTLQAAG